MDSLPVYSGNTARFHSVFERAGQGGHISLVFLGSSITLGYQIETRHQFTSMIQKYFQDTFHNNDISCHNLSAPGMPSMHGLHLAYSELESYAPDVIFIDYAVNDQKNRMFREAYESLLIKCLSLPTEPAVASFFVKTQNGYTCAPQMAAVCEYYGVPYVNIGAWLDGDIEAGIMRWRDYSYDGCHPGPVGHGYIGHCLLRLLEHLSQVPGKPAISLPAKGFYSNDLAQLRFCPLAWENSAEHHAAPLELEANCRTLFIGYFVDTTEEYGTACLSVDGKPYCYFDSYRVHEWDHPAYEVVYLAKEKKERHLRLNMQTGESDKRFRLLCLGII